MLSVTTAADAVLSVPDWSRRLAVLGPRQHLTLVGVTEKTLAADRQPDAHPMLQLDLSGVVSHREAIARVLDDLADLALVTWPCWPPSSFVPWSRPADRLASAGRPPRFSDAVAAATQFEALHPAAGAPILIFPIDPSRAERAAPRIDALEWCCRHGAAAVAFLPELPLLQPPWDRILHDAVIEERLPPAPVLERLVPQPSPGPRGSAVERRMRAALRDAADLAGLFEDEQTLRLGPLGPTPRVDLLWRAGKVVVELDGAEHERDPNYGADRHRDYELLVAGYLVLRLTNAEVELDLSRALDKIRRVVDLRKEIG